MPMNRSHTESLMLRAAIFTILAACLATPLRAQGGIEIEGAVRSAVTDRPLAGALVRLVGTGRETVTRGNGLFGFDDLRAGTYTLRVERLGHATVEREIEIRQNPPPILVELEESALALEGLVVTGTVSAREADEAIRPVNVLRAEELQRNLQTTIAATLAGEPGLSMTSMGPATARPVIRGMSGDRLLVLEDGNRVNDVSNSGPDHAVSLDPMSARRIEVVRGPGAILYGSNAIGGVVNVIRDEIPSQVPEQFSGTVTAQGRSINSELTSAVQARTALTERIPFRVEFGGSTSGDLGTPLGNLDNTGTESWSAGAGASWVGGQGYFGGAVLTRRNDYGLPGGFTGGHPEGVNIESERHSFKLRARHRPVDRLIESLEADASYSYYEHTEIEPPDILGTFFSRETLNGDLLARHGEFGPLSAGAVGARVSRERFGFGGSVFTPDTDRTSAGIFVYEEVDLEPVRLEAGLRYDWTRTTPEAADPDSDIGDVRERRFGSLSGSIGLVVTPAHGFNLGVSLSRAFRTPDVNELFSEGPHLAAYSFEVGNPSLDEEIGTGVDVFARVHGDQFHAEVTGFVNDLSGYVYARDTGELSRVRLPIYQFVGEDARFMGLEAAAEWAVSGPLKLEASGSYVRGTIVDTDEPLPLVPPLQGHAAIAWEPADWFLRAEGDFAAEQDRVGEFEETTDGYAVLGLSTGVRLTLGGRLHVVTLGIENVTDEEYRNHLSRVKEILPEAGRGLKLTYRVVF